MVSQQKGWTISRKKKYLIGPFGCKYFFIKHFALTTIVYKNIEKYTVHYVIDWTDFIHQIIFLFMKISLESALVIRKWFPEKVCIKNWCLMSLLYIITIQNLLRDAKPKNSANYMVQRTCK